MPSIKIRVGASLDANALSVFAPVERASARARTKIKSAFDQAAADQAKAAAKGATASEKAAAQAAKAAEKEAKKAADAATREAKRAADAEIREAKRAADGAEREADRLAKYKLSVQLRSAAMASREMERQDRLATRERERTERDLARGGRIGIGRRASIGVSRGAAMAYGYGGAAMSAAAEALGIDTDVAAMAQQGFANQDRAQQIINAAPSTTGMSVSSRQEAARGLETEAQHAGNATATPTGDILEGIGKFVALTGDLDTAKATMTEIATLSKATGSSMADMGAAAAEVSNHLGDVPDKAGATMAVMRAIAGEGKLGALEIRDMAKQMAKMASQAPKFEGDMGKNIALLGAMAQESKLRGGSASAGQAATSVMRFASSLSVPTTIKHWAGAGLNAFTDKTYTKLRSPEEIVLDALRVTKGNQKDLANLFPSQQGIRAVQGFANIYGEAGGGQAGLEAVDAEFKRLSHAAMTQEEVTRAFTAQMQSAQSQVQIFNNQMQQTVEQLDGALLPAFQALAPMVVAAVGKFTELLGIDPDEDSRAKDKRRRGDIITATEDELKAGTVDPGHVAALQKEGEGIAAELVVRKLKHGEDTKAQGDKAQWAIQLAEHLPFGFGKMVKDKEDKSEVEGKEISALAGQLDKVHEVLKDIHDAVSRDGIRVKTMPKVAPRPGTAVTPAESPIDEP